MTWGHDGKVRSLALIGVLGFGLLGASLLPSLEYFFDEGVAVQQARLIRAGELPYRDFFYHQTPLYPLTLAALTAPAPDSLFAHRLPSLLATLATGWLVFRLAGAMAGGAVALLAMVLFYTAPLQYFGLVAAPNAAMLLAATAGVACIAVARGRGAVLAGGAIFAVALLLKPIAIATATGVGLFLLLSREQRWKLGWAVLGGAGCGAAAWLTLDWGSAGAFTELLALQASRHGEAAGFELMRQYPSVGGPAASNGIETLLGWNLHQHVQTFLSRPLSNPFFPLLALAVVGQVWLVSPMGRSRFPRLASYAPLLTCWWLVPLGFSLFVWDPTWQFYFVQYLPPLSILAAVGAVGLASIGARLATRAIDGRAALWPRAVPGAVAVAAVAWAGASGVVSLAERRSDYAMVPRPADGEAWLLFDPFLNFVSGSQPACGLIDPFNVYAGRSLAATASPARRSPHHVASEDLIRCLEADPAIRIGLGYWAQWFVDPPLREYLAQLPDERFVPMRLHYRPADAGLPASPARIRR
ncbi:MAG: glycosyltransferase family 39 protein [Myxococcota bacterium]|nr:glycosyltransferase family 39 protein [Myxococcota bacterium]